MAELNVSEVTQQNYVRDNEEAYLASRKKQEDKDEFQKKELAKKYTAISSWKARQKKEAKKEVKAADTISTVEQFLEVAKKVILKKKFTLDEIVNIGKKIKEIVNKIQVAEAQAIVDDKEEKIKEFKAKKKAAEAVAKKAADDVAAAEKELKDLGVTEEEAANE